MERAYHGGEGSSRIQNCSVPEWPGGWEAMVASESKRTAASPAEGHDLKEWGPCC